MDTRKNRWMLRGLALGLLLLASCSSNKTIPAPEASESRQALLDALEAWRNGEAPDALAQKSPALHVADEDWSNGVRLRNYQIGDESDVIGTSIRCQVVLHLQDPQGTLLPPRKVVYQAAGRSVVRADNRGE